jgi:hypothetical protein
MAPTVGTETSQKLLSAEHRVRAGWDSVCKSKLTKLDIHSIEEGVVEGIPNFRIGKRALGCRCHIIASRMMRVKRK